MKKILYTILIGSLTFITATLQAESERVVVIHLENQNIIAGFGSESNPKITLPAVVGYPKSTGPALMMGMANRPLFGDKALEQKSKLRIVYTLNAGKITNLKEFEKLVQHVLYSRLRVQPDEVKIFVLDSEAGSMRENLARLFFETFNVKGLLLMNQKIGWKKAADISVTSQAVEAYMTRDEYDERGASYVHKKFR